MLSLGIFKHTNTGEKSLLSLLLLFTEFAELHQELDQVTFIHTVIVSTLSHLDRLR